MFQYNFLDELIVDNFAGGGGASTGIELAIGRPVDVAINHDQKAIEMHKVNHPFTEHYCESVWDIDPRAVCKGRKVGLCWFSPDCKHFSKAKGGKPVEKNVRGLAWIAARWADLVRPRVIILENVEEFQTWCRIGKDGRPDFNYKGENFRSFVNALKHIGYEVDWRELKACDYGAPTIRKRFFLIARCDGLPIVFPQPTYGEGKGLKPYKTAGDIIDWSIPSKSIFERNKPLVDATMRRIARGIEKFVLKNNKPFIQQANFENVPKSVDDPLNTVTTGNHFYEVEPILGLARFNDVPKSIHEPIHTLTTVNKSMLVAPILTKFNDKSKGQSIEKPLDTVMAGATRFGIVNCFISKAYRGNYRGAGSSLSEPLHTVTCQDHNVVNTVFISKYYTGESDNASSLNDPLHTIRAQECHSKIDVELKKEGFGLGNWKYVREMFNKYLDFNLKIDEILLIKIKGIFYFISDIKMRMLTPRELYNAQGFPSDYKIDFDVNGKAYSKKEQVARCGNSVCPQLATALVKANLVDMSYKKQLTTMAELEKVMVG